MRASAAVAVAGACTVLVGAVELLHARAARRDAAPDDRTHATGARPAVVVLGYPTRASGRPHPVQRWRVAIAVRTVRRRDADLVVFTGGAVRNPHVEAGTMAALAHRRGLRDVTVVVEPEARSTRENARYARPHVAGRPLVLLASDPMHVARARRLWLEARPEDAGAVFGGDTYRPLERWPLKAVSAGFELLLARRLRRGAT